jgi:hypothetical protein
MKKGRTLKGRGSGKVEKARNEEGQPEGERGVR